MPLPLPRVPLTRFSAGIRRVPVLDIHAIFGGVPGCPAVGYFSSHVHDRE